MSLGKFGKLVIIICAYSNFLRYVKIYTTLTHHTWPNGIVEDESLVSSPRPFLRRLLKKFFYKNVT